jgi:hypothetical protein
MFIFSEIEPVEHFSSWPERQSTAKQIAANRQLAHAAYLKEIIRLQSNIFYSETTSSMAGRPR